MSDTRLSSFGHRWFFILIGAVILGVSLSATSSIAAENPKDPADQSDEQTSAKKNDQAPPDTPDGDATQPCITGPSNEGPCIDTDKIPRFVKNSPFDKDSGTPTLKKERMLWAESWIWTEAPEFVVEKWLTDKPDTKGKYVLIEFWATWCGPCRRSISLLNGFHKKYGDELAVIGVCEEDEQNTRELNDKYPDIPEIEFYSAVDTQKRMKDKLGVWGIPHVIIVEPNEGVVIWEGFPLQPGYELTEKTIQKFLEVGRRLRAQRESEAP